MKQNDNTWNKVLLARSTERPTAQKLINEIFPDFIELHGDRLFGDDASIIGGLATINGIPITIIAEEKGVNTEDKIKRNFGMPHPEGYRKALRLMKQAEKFNRPVLTIIDTPGAYPGLGAEERGQAFAIANNLKELMNLKTPIIVVVLGEGGSGGALAIGVGDRILMFENSIYSILSPEGFASILFKDVTKAKEVSSLMKLTAKDLLDLKVIDDIILEGPGLNKDYNIGFKNFKETILNNLENLLKTNTNDLLLKRFKKFRSMGVFTEIKNEDKYED